MAVCFEDVRDVLFFLVMAGWIIVVFANADVIITEPHDHPWHTRPLSLMG